ncbi:common pilus major fimbrillin subunit EcpA [Vibrio cincinnatiensis]|uniref:common pilus major fimbrillin subunit EcpA n=1 Tax=Vibrio cincinnatiensis TaxID=675 RepID=UPI0012ACDDFE|nr:common pilus major fimbrillin subunit EcpA [Vibrio cincinnatiensis]
MKIKSRVALAITAGILLTSTSTMAKEASATATWSATAIKDTTSDLVVTPLGSLSFDYAAGIGENGAFNAQKGLFDVTIAGDATATDFTLKAKKVAGTLTNSGGHASTLEVGVLWNGEKIGKTTEVTLIDTSASINGQNLSPIASGFNSTDRISAQEAFTFNIEDATTDGATSVDGDFSQLPDGLWTGDVKVEFIAEWI